MTHTIDILKANKSDCSSVWQEESIRHREDWAWMKYSMQIAIKVRSRMKELGLTQTTLAAKIGCSQQYVSLLLKGKENLTLETIAKIESALDLQFFGSTLSAVTGNYTSNQPRRHYLSENIPPDYGKK